MSNGVVTSPKNILEDCKQLAGNLVTHARQRTVISRAYYAAYHAAVLHFEGMGSPFVIDKQKRMGMHRQFICAIKSSQDDLTRRIGARLEKIYNRRVSADYQLGDIMLPEFAEAALEDAEEIVIDMLGDRLE